MARASKPLPTGHDPSHVATQNWKDLHPEVQTHFGNSNAFRAWKKRQQPQGPTPEEHTAAGLIDQAKAHPKVRIETWSGDEAPQAWDVHNPAENLDTALRRVGGHSLDIIIPGESATRVTSGEGTGAPDIHTEQPIAVRHRLRRDQDYNPASPSGGYRPASATATGRRRGADTAAHPAQGATGTPAQVPGAASQDALEKAVADLDRARAQVTEPRDFDDPDLNAIAKKVSDPEKGRADLRDKVAKSPGAARAAVTAVEETGKARQRAADAAERVVKNTAAVTADKVPTPPDVLQWRKRTPSELNPGVEYEDYDQSDEERAARAKENAEKAGASSDSDSAPTSGVDASPQFSDLRDVAADVGDAVGFDPKEDDYAELERKLGRTKDVLAGGWRIQTNVPSSTETSLGGPDVEQRADAYASGVGVGVQHPDRGSVDVTGGIHPVNAPAQSHPYAQRRLKMAQRIAGSVPRPPSQGSTSPAMPGFETDKGQTTQPRGYDVPEVSTEDIPESQYREPSGQTAPARKEQEPKTPSEMVAEFGTQTTGQAKPTWKR